MPHAGREGSRTPPHCTAPSCTRSTIALRRVSVRGLLPSRGAPAGLACRDPCACHAKSDHSEAHA
eukprot:1218986-Amphidinium_carterae.1